MVWSQLALLYLCSLFSDPSLSQPPPVTLSHPFPYTTPLFGVFGHQSCHEDGERNYCNISPSFVSRSTSPHFPSHSTVSASVFMMLSRDVLSPRRLTGAWGLNLVFLVFLYVTIVFQVYYVPLPDTFPP